MSEHSMHGYWKNIAHDSNVEGLVYIDELGRYVEKIASDEKANIIGGWQKLWLERIDDKSCKVSNKPSFADSWLVGLSVSEKHMQIIGVTGIASRYEKISEDDVPSKHKERVKSVIGKMIPNQ